MNLSHERDARAHVDLDAARRYLLLAALYRVRRCQHAAAPLRAQVSAGAERRTPRPRLSGYQNAYGIEWEVRGESAAAAAAGYWARAPLRCPWNR